MARATVSARKIVSTTSLANYSYFGSSFKEQTPVPVACQFNPISNFSPGKTGRTPIKRESTIFGSSPAKSSAFGSTFAQANTPAPALVIPEAKEKYDKSGT